MTSLVNNYTDGNLTKQMIRFSIPFVISNTLQILYSVVDMIVVGQYVGSSGLSAVSVASNIISLITTLCLGFATGGEILIAQKIGVGDRKATSHIIGTMFTTILSASLIMSVICVSTARPFLTLLNTPTEAFEDAVTYVIICGSGTIFIFGYNAVSAMLRGSGNSKMPLIFITIASVSNLILDLIFVGVIGLGVAGAAWATLLGQVISFVFSIIYLFHKKEAFGFDFKPKSFIPNKEQLRLLIKLGVPFALQSCTINISTICVSSFVNLYGVYAAATFAVGSKVLQIPDIIGRSLSMAGSTMIAQNMAVKKFERIKRIVYTCIIANAGIFTIAGIILGLFPQQIFSIFTTDQEVLDLAWTYLSMYILCFPAYVFLNPCNSFVKGIGNAKLTLAVALFDAFILRIGLSYLVGTVMGFGLMGFFFGYHFATFGTAVPTAVYFFRNKWQKRNLLS